jgi:hypothetical protein
MEQLASSSASPGRVFQFDAVRLQGFEVEEYQLTIS